MVYGSKGPIKNDTQNYPFYRLQLKGLALKLMNQPIKIQFKVPKVVKPIRKHYLGD